MHTLPRSQQRTADGSSRARPRGLTESDQLLRLPAQVLKVGADSASVIGTKMAATRPAATAAGRDRADENARRLKHITESREAAQTDLA